MKAKLGIGIITRNRPKHLAVCTAEAFVQSMNYDTVVRVFDNASEPPAKAEIITIRHEKNLGFAGNYRFAVKHLAELGAEYIWIMPDDKVLLAGAVTRVLRTAWDCPTDLIVIPQEHHPLELGPYETKTFLIMVHRYAPELLLAAGHLGCVAFKADLFEEDWFNRAVAQGWSYPHLPAVMHNVNTVAVLPVPYLADIRPPAHPADEDLPATDSDWNWRKCIEYLNGRFNTEIDITAESRRMNAYYRRRLLREPHKVFAENIPNLTRPSRWPAMFGRLFKAIFHSNV